MGSRGINAEDMGQSKRLGMRVHFGMLGRCNVRASGTFQLRGFQNLNQSQRFRNERLHALRRTKQGEAHCRLCLLASPAPTMSKELLAEATNIIAGESNFVQSLRFQL